MQAAWTGAAGAISLLGGGALAALSWRAPFAIYLVTPLLIPAVLRLVPTRRPRRPEKPMPASSTLQLPAAPMSLAPLLSLAMLSMALLYLVPVQAPFLLAARLQAKGPAIGAAISIVTLVSVLGSLAFSRLLDALGRKRLHGLGFSALALGFGLFAGARTWPMVALSLSLVGLGMGPLLPALVHDASELASEERRGAVMGALTASLFAGQFLCPILSQPLIDHGSIGHVFAAASGLSLLVAAAPFLVPKAVLRPARGAIRG